MATDDHDVIDPTNWMIIRDMITASHDANIPRFRAASLRLEDEVPVDEKAGRYILYLLWRRVIDLLKSSPTDGDFRRLAERTHEKAEKSLKVSIDDLEAIIRIPFGEQDRNAHVDPGLFIIGGSAILGGLFDDLPAELDALHPHLADWYRRAFPQS